MVVVVVESVMSMIDAHHEKRDHHLLGDEAHPITGALHLAVTSIPTFRLAEAVVD